MKKILFIVPMSKASVIMPPLGIGYLATIARYFGYNVTILDCLRDKIDITNFEKYIKSNRFDIFGISMMTFNFNTAKEYTEIIKKLNKDLVVVLGGSHPSGDYENILNDFPNADFAFRGEAELGFKEFLEELKKPKNKRKYKNVSNLIWRKDDKIIINEWKVIDDLDSIKFPAWDLIDPRTYPISPHTVFAVNFPVAPIIVTRGCPFQCTFCSGRTVTGTVVRKRSIENVMSEIDFLIRNYGVKEIHIEDDNFTLHKDFVMEFCNELIKRNYGISWALPNGVRLDTLDEEMLFLMEKSGCHYFAVGIEFGTDKMLKLTNKQLTIAMIKEKISLISKFNMKINGFFMLGVPDETREDMLKTIELSKELPIHNAQFSNFIPLPGSYLYKRLKREGKVENKDLERFLAHDVPFVPDGMTERELKNLQRRAFLEFYLRPKIIFNLLKSIRNTQQFFRLVSRVVESWK
jgi:radical SAM superfamily enzyme YgiQ (UPF0313 family)